MEASEASSAINTPHPDSDDKDEAELFFDEDGGGEKEEVSAPPAAEGVESRKLPDEPRPEGEPPEDLSVPGAAEPEESNEHEASPEPSEPEEGATRKAEGSASAEQQASPAKTGTAEREYIVFQRRQLTEKFLRGLLHEVEKGNIAEPRIAYFELGRPVARNDKQAAAAAYRENRETLPDTCDLASVSSRSFKVRHVEPKRVERTNLSVT